MQDGLKVQDILKGSQTISITIKDLKSCQPPPLIDKKSWHGEITVCYILRVQKVSLIYQSPAHLVNKDYLA